MPYRQLSRTARNHAAALLLSLLIALTALAVPASLGGHTAGASAASGSDTVGGARPPRGGTATPQPTAPSSTSTSRDPNTPTDTTRPARDGTSTGNAPQAAPPPPSSSGQYGCPGAEELLMLRLINDYRASNGVAAVTMSPTLTSAAEFHSRDMVARNYFSHDLPGIGTWSDNISSHGYAFGTRAENIAAGYSDAASTFDQWVNSTPHRANMLNPDLHAIGIGAAYGGGSQYGTYWTTTFGGSVDDQMAC